MRRGAKSSNSWSNLVGQSPPTLTKWRVLIRLPGDFSNALRWLQIELQTPQYFSHRSIGDSDLFPLWQWLTGGALVLQDAHRLLALRLERYCVAACHPNAEVQLDENDLKGLPEKFRDLFRFNFKVGIFEVNPTAIAAQPALAREFHEVRERYIARVASMIRAGINKALDIVLHAQPKYAAKKAAAGNHLGFRYHVVWALARRPELIGMFYVELGGWGFHTLLDSLSEAERIAPGFCKRMERLGDLIFSDLDEAWKLLDEAPGLVRQHPLFQLRQAMAYVADTDYQHALPIYLKLCETWPDDAVGFANACDCLMHLGRWTEAQAVFDRAPQCYQAFHLYHSQRENLKQRALVSSPPKNAPFCGQPDLGGLLGPPQTLKSQPIAVCATQKPELRQKSILDIIAEGTLARTAGSQSRCINQPTACSSK